MFTDSVATIQTQLEKGYINMTELEKVEKLREKANVSFAEAKEALDKTGGDILDALIYLEKNGKVTEPAGGGFFSGADMPVQAETVTSSTKSTGSTSGGSGEEFADLMKRFGAFCLKMFNKGISNHLVARKDGQQLFSCPVLIVILLAIFFFWIIGLLFVISLFCGVRYHFTGDDLGRDSVNSVMDGATNVVNDVKRTFADSVNKTENTDKE